MTKAQRIGFDGMMVILDKEYNEKAAKNIQKQISEIKGVESVSPAIMNLEKVIATAEYVIKKMGHTWIKIGEGCIGVMTKKSEKIFF